MGRTGQLERLVEQIGKCGREGEAGTGCDCSHWAPPGLSTSASSDSGPLPLSPDWRSLGGKAWGTDLLSGPQGAVLQSLLGAGALASNCLQSGAGAGAPPLLSQPLLHPSPMSSLPGAKLLITIIPHVPHPTLYKSSGPSISSDGSSPKTGVKQNETLLFIPPPPFYKETEDQAGSGI